MLERGTFFRLQENKNKRVGISQVEVCVVGNGTVGKSVIYVQGEHELNMKYCLVNILWPVFSGNVVCSMGLEKECSFLKKVREKSTFFQ